MRRVVFQTEIFRTAKDRRRGEVALSAYLEALFRINKAFLCDYPDFPLLYQTRVRYRREPAGFEKWKSIPVVFKDGYGDCEDLACWLAAEINIRRGIPAVPKWVLQPSSQPGLRLYHIVVEMPDGRELDPSKRLGMEGSA